MYRTRLLVSASLLSAMLFLLASCKKDDIGEPRDRYENYGLKLTGAQVKPVSSPSAATADMDVTYNRTTHVLTYKVTWQGLSDSVIAIRLNGPAPSGFNSVNPAFTGASPTAFTTTPYVSLQTVTGTAPRALYPAAGTYTSSVIVDGVKIKELDLLNGYYYVTIHTKTFLPVAAPGNLLYRWLGEIRGQVIFE